MIASKLKENPKQSISIRFEDRFIKPADWYWWVAFTAVNMADVHSTYKAMEYECIFEANPLLPNRPSLERLVAHKVVTLYPIYHPDWNRHPVTNKDLKWATAFVGLVAYHNYKILDKVKELPERCPKVNTL